jgi:MFS superfamily sulfate permease-like transporter
VVLTWADGHWRARPATPGTETQPGLIVYRFEAQLFFANADYFASRVQALVRGAPHPVRWLVLDLVSLGDIDYTGGLLLFSTVRRLQQAGLTVAIAEADGVAHELDKYGISQQVAASRLFETVGAAVEAFTRQLPPG